MHLCVVQESRMESSLASGEVISIITCSTTRSLKRITTTCSPGRVSPKKIRAMFSNNCLLHHI